MLIELSAPLGRHKTAHIVLPNGQQLALTEHSENNEEWLFPEPVIIQAEERYTLIFETDMYRDQYEFCSDETNELTRITRRSRR